MRGRFAAEKRAQVFAFVSCIILALSSLGCAIAGATSVGVAIAGATIVGVVASFLGSRKSRT